MQICYLEAALVKSGHEVEADAQPKCHLRTGSQQAASTRNEQAWAGVKRRRPCSSLSPVCSLLVALRRQFGTTVDRLGCVGIHHNSGVYVLQQPQTPAAGARVIKSPGCTRSINPARARRISSRPARWFFVHYLAETKTTNRVGTFVEANEPPT